MDERSKERLKDILSKSIPSLTEDDKVFLRGRRDYLKPSQLKDYQFLTQTSKEPVKKKHAKKQKTN